MRPTSTIATPLLHDSVAELAARHQPGRRILDPSAARAFHLVARNDFLTPRGRVYKWQEVAAELDRGVLGGTLPVMAPVRYTWRGVRSRTGSPKETGQEREWTFVRGQTFDVTPQHTELTGAVPPEAPRSDPMPGHTRIGYPGLPRSPAVDLLVLSSWDVVTFELLCTQLIITPDLGEVGSRAELARYSDTEAQFAFSDPEAVARFRNARTTAEHLGYGSAAGRPTAVYATRCLDCRLDVRSGPLAQRGRSSYWITLQLDLETRDLLAAEMTETIVAVLVGEDGREVPVHKRRSVRLWVPAPGEDPPALTAPAAAPPSQSSPAAGPDGAGAPEAPAASEASAAPETPAAPEAPERADPAELGEAVRLAARVCDYLAWQVSWSDYLPEGLAELTLMGFRRFVGSDLPEAHARCQALRSELSAAVTAGGRLSGALRAALPEHRRRLEGLLDFSELAVGGTEGFADKPEDAAGRAAVHDRLGSFSADVAELRAILGRLEAPPRTSVPTVPADPDPEGES
jgi:hypothetical protein